MPADHVRDMVASSHQPPDGTGAVAPSSILATDETLSSNSSPPESAALLQNQTTETLAKRKAKESPQEANSEAPEKKAKLQEPVNEEPVNEELLNSESAGSATKNKEKIKTTVDLSSAGSKPESSFSDQKKDKEVPKPTDSPMEVPTLSNKDPVVATEHVVPPPSAKDPVSSGKERKVEETVENINNIKGNPSHSKEEHKTAKNGNGETKEANEEPVLRTTEDIVNEYNAPLPPLTSRGRPLKALSNSEKLELERLFGMDKGLNKWDDDDWVGVVALAEADVKNPDARHGEKTKPRTLIGWAENGKKSLKLLYNLIRHVSNHKKTPNQAKKILSNADPKSIESLRDAIGRLSIDPLVLRQDGWTTVKASTPEGASGGAYRIGEKVIWQGYEGVVIAFVHDAYMGDLWKAMWIEDFSTFDMELEELNEARKKYERKKQPRNQSGDKKASSSANSDLSRRSGRNVSTADFQVEGIEHGIVLATSYARGARHGVFWPARVMHASELRGSQNKRNNRQKVDVVFLAPYWNSDPLAAGGRRTEAFSDSIARHGDSLFSSGPLFEIESINADDECIQRYPYDADTGLDIDELRTSFKFSGLPKAVFSRFLDSHRLALSLKTYSQNELKSTGPSDIHRTSAGLLEGHPLSAQTPIFPSAVLHLPFDHILSQLPHPEQEISAIAYKEDIGNGEPALQLGRILDSMKPPVSLGLGGPSSSGVQESPRGLQSTPISFEPVTNGNKEDPQDVNRFLSGCPSLQSLLSETSPTSMLLKNNLNGLVSIIPSSAVHQLQEKEQKKKMTRLLYKIWIVMKAQGENLISSLKQEASLKEWRRCCERIYKHFNSGYESFQCESGLSAIITDSRCNLHLTSGECFERPVRIPAAMKGIKQATGNIQIVDVVSDKYLELAENDIILRAHKKSYVARIKKRCLTATQDAVIALTEDSDGNGGHDTMGVMGSWKAAVAAVGAALQGVDMIMNGEYTNAFCPTRPPGHHAGRELHAMKAVSNGFCVLNPVACAALYATAPLSEGGLGLSRVCVIDIDVHHGNGTQDILCSTYDPRFLYVSIHAGGANVNGVDLGELGEDVGHHLGRNSKKGIFPGRCGDTSPHKGVLNIPLGGRVTSHALGTALMTKVSPTVDSFAPELIIVSAGFDAHKNDPLNLGGLSAEDFGTLTEIICKLAFKSCSGRVLSVLEGGYGVPCCRPQQLAPANVNITRHPDQNGKKNDNVVEKKTDVPNSEENKLDVQTEPSRKETGVENAVESTTSEATKQEQPVQLMCLDLGIELPADMPDVVSSYALQKRLDKCHAEGFVHCVREHVSALARCNVPK